MISAASFCEGVGGVGFFMPLDGEKRECPAHGNRGFLSQVLVTGSLLVQWVVQHFWGMVVSSSEGQKGFLGWAAAYGLISLAGATFLF